MTCRQWMPAVLADCGQPARLFRDGPRCADHTPAKQAGRDEPPTTPLEKQR